MTKHTSQRPNQQVGALKALLLTGSVIATLAGTRVLAQQASAVDATAIADSTAAVVPAASTDTSAIPLPPTSRGTQVQLNPIPQVVQPQVSRPVARTRSSR